MPSAGAAGATNMADAHARATDTLGVAVTSTGTGAGNAAGALVEPLSAETPLLHLTGQIDTPHLDRGHGFIHETRSQPEMLAAVSKATFLVREPAECAAVLRAAARTALTPPRGPVSVELPADVQVAKADLPDNDPAPLAIPDVRPEEGALDQLAGRCCGSAAAPVTPRRPRGDSPASASESSRACEGGVSSPKTIP